MVQFLELKGDLNMYVGNYEGKIDYKNRFYVPSCYRSISKDYVVTLIDADTLVFNKKEGWKPEQVLNGAEVSSEKLSSFLNYIIMNSFIVSLDKEGRLVIPKKLMNVLSFDKEFVIIGHLDYFVVVNKYKYNLECEEVQREFDDFLNSSKGKTYKRGLKNL